MSALLSAIGCALLGLAVGAALQRWGDGERKLHGHKEPIDWTEREGDGPDPSVWAGVPITRWGGSTSEDPLRYQLHNQIADQWTGW